MNWHFPSFRSLGFMIVCGCLLAACKPSLPSGVMSESKMERVLYDYHLAQGMAETIPYDGGRSIEQMRYEYQQAVFRKHGITEAEFDSSLVYYCSDLTRMNRIYSRLNDRLQREADALGVAIGPRDVFAGLSAEGDTANVWRDRPLFVIKSQVMDNLQSWEQECDSTWQPGDDVLWRFNTMKISHSHQTDVYADLVIVYSNDSVRSQLMSVGGREKAELRIDNPRDWTPRLVTGHIFSPIETKTEERHYFFILQPSLIRFHQPLSVREQWAKADSLQTDSIVLDSVAVDSLSQTGDSAIRRRTPEEFREEQLVTPSINVVKEKPYSPGTGKNRRRRQNMSNRKLSNR